MTIDTADPRIERFTVAAHHLLSAIAAGEVRRFTFHAHDGALAEALLSER